MGADLPKSVAGQTAEPEGIAHHQRQKQADAQGQPPVHPEQNPQDAEELDPVVEQGDDHRGEHLVHVLDVVGQPGYQAAGRVAVKKLQLEMQEMNKHHLPHPVHDSLPGPLQNQHLDKVAEKFKGHEGAEKQGQVLEPGKANLGSGAGIEDKIIHSQPDQIGQGEAASHDNKGKQHGQHGSQPVRPAQKDDAPPQAEIAELAQLVFFEIAVIIPQG